jgi:hypothetical protein
MAELYPRPLGNTLLIGGSPGAYTKRQRVAGMISTAPVFGSVLPLTDAIGGALVTITGTFPLAISSVLFGVAPATVVVRVNSTTITCTSPANAPGGYIITITDVLAQSGASPPNAYTYTGPV